MSSDEIKIVVKDILGVSSPFWQGGSLRITIPKKAINKFGLNKKLKKEYFSLVFLETDKGLFLIPLDELVRPDNIREALKFVDLSHLSDDEILDIFRTNE